MKKNPSRKVHVRSNRAAAIPPARWLSYAVAGAATTVAASHADAGIHYSGKINVELPAAHDAHATFQLDKPGDSIFFERLDQANDFAFDFAGFKVSAEQSGQFAGLHYKNAYRWPYRLQRGSSVAAQKFTVGLASVSGFGTLAISNFAGYFLDRGVGYIGFSFNGGAGQQYGWARVRMRDPSKGNSFEVVDYAYADPGETISTGQTSEETAAAPVSSMGSLGLLAAGAAGLVGWRQRRTKLQPAA